mmetsp:Transcript_36996/g.73618  ORF Transcript_36996/g.73618 Transcript_36996/m.73618 type:complete len:371 (+) Transcript_36996:9-1121(+)
MSQKEDQPNIVNPQEDSKGLTLEVIIPENSTPGETITVQCPDNNNFVQFETPHHVVPGDTVHIEVSDSTEQNKQDSVETANYRGVAAITTGVLVSAIFIGPIITGALVVGIVVAAAQRVKGGQKPSHEVTEEDRMEGGTATHEDSQEIDPDRPNAAPADTLKTREQKIATAVVKTTDYIAEKWSAVDERFAISGSTLKAIATLQEMDERNKISDTVITSIKSFDEKYQLSHTAGSAVTNTVSKVQEWDESCKLSENVSSAGSNLATCLVDFERHYDISSRISAALFYSINTLSAAVALYTLRLSNHNATSADIVNQPGLTMETQQQQESHSALSAASGCGDISVASAPIDCSLYSRDERDPTHEAPEVPV